MIVTLRVFAWLRVHVQANKDAEWHRRVSLRARKGHPPGRVLTRPQDGASFAQTSELAFNSAAVQLLAIFLMLTFGADNTHDTNYSLVQNNTLPCSYVVLYFSQLTAF